MKPRFRIVYTVTREVDDENISEARDAFEAVKFEPDEYLYGCSGLPEDVTASLEVSVDGDTWLEVTENVRPSK